MRSLGICEVAPAMLMAATAMLAEPKMGAPMQRKPISPSSSSKEYPTSRTFLSSRASRSGEEIVFLLLRAIDLPAKLWPEMKSSEYASRALPTPELLASSLLPTQVARRSIPGASAFSMMTASAPSRIARCAVNPVCSISSRRNGLTCSRRSRFSRAILLRLTNLSPKQNLPVSLLFFRYPVASRVLTSTCVELLGRPSRLLMSERVNPRCDCASSSNIFIARPTDGTE